MQCPVCGKEMVEGGLIGNGALSIDWYPKEEFEKKWFKTLYYKGGKNLGASVAHVTKVPHAWYCSSCNKVTGIFDAFDIYR